MEHRAEKDSGIVELGGKRFADERSRYLAESRLSARREDRPLKAKAVALTLPLFFLLSLLIKEANTR